MRSRQRAGLDDWTARVGAPGQGHTRNRVLTSRTCQGHGLRGPGTSKLRAPLASLPRTLPSAQPSQKSPDRGGPQSRCRSWARVMSIPTTDGATGPRTQCRSGSRAPCRKHRGTPGTCWTCSVRPMLSTPSWNGLRRSRARDAVATLDRGGRRDPHSDRGTRQGDRSEPVRSGTRSKGCLPPSGRCLPPSGRLTCTPHRGSAWRGLPVGVGQRAHTYGSPRARRGRRVVCMVAMQVSRHTAGRVTRGGLGDRPGLCGPGGPSR